MTTRFVLCRANPSAPTLARLTVFLFPISLSSSTKKPHELCAGKCFGGAGTTAVVVVDVPQLSYLGLGLKG